MPDLYQLDVGILKEHVSWIVGRDETWPLAPRRKFTSLCLWKIHENGAYLGGGNSNIFSFSTPKIGEDEPNLTTVIFFNWVGSTTNQICIWQVASITCLFLWFMAEQDMWFLVVQKWYHPVWCITMLWFISDMFPNETYYNIYLSSICIPLMLSLKRATESWCGFEGEELDQQRWGRKSRVITLMLLIATRNPANSPVEGSWNPVICRVFWDTSKRWLFGISEPSTVSHQSFTSGERFFSWWCNCRHLSL